MSGILKIDDLWGGYKEDVDILQGVSLEVQQGEAVGIIGLNGSGKSTLGKAIMNMIPFRRGVITFEGEDITKLSTSKLSHRGLSIMQQGGRVFRTISMWDNLQLALYKQPKETLDRLRDIIPMLQQPQRQLQHTMADKLSGGQKHQLSLAMTLATNPRLVILDEPSAGLSPKAVEDMYVMLQAVRDTLGVTIILIEQNIARAISFCDRYAIMQTGQLNLLSGNRDIQEIEKIMFK